MTPDPSLFIQLFVYFIFFAVIIYLLWDRASIVESYQKDKDRLLDELSKAIKAVISKNANDYVMTTSIDKVPSEEKPFRSPDEIPEETLSDDEFFDAIGKGLKVDKK